MTHSIVPANNGGNTRPTTVYVPNWREQLSAWWNGLDITKRRAVLVAVGIVALIAFAIAMYSKGKGVDVVNGVPAVSSNFEPSMPETLAALKPLSVADRGAYMGIHHPNLARKIMVFLRETGKLGPNQDVSRIEYRFGSMSGVVAETANGGKVKGYFNDQLLALAYPVGAIKPIVVMVTCTNGLLDYPISALDRLPAFGAQTGSQMIFKIQHGQGLVNYLDYRTAIWAARQLNIPLSKRAMGEHSFTPITPDQALALEGQTDHIRVVGALHEGDVIDLGNMTINGQRR